VDEVIDVSVELVSAVLFVEAQLTRATQRIESAINKGVRFIVFSSPPVALAPFKSRTYFIAEDADFIESS
jgi:hypothetical protein